MNLLGLEVKDREVLPLQRIDRDFVEKVAFDCDHEWLVAQSRVNVVSFNLAESDHSKRLLA